MLIKDIYNNSSSPEKIFNFQKTSDLKVLITTIRLNTTVTRNSVNVSIGNIYIYFVIIFIEHIFINHFNYIKYNLDFSLTYT